MSTPLRWFSQPATLLPHPQPVLSMSSAPALWESPLWPPHPLPSPRSGDWHTSSLSTTLPSSLLTPELPPHPMDGLPVGPTPPPLVIKAGWLDKNPPQG